MWVPHLIPYLSPSLSSLAGLHLERGTGARRRWRDGRARCGSGARCGAALGRGAARRWDSGAWCGTGRGAEEMASRTDSALLPKEGE